MQRQDLPSFKDIQDIIELVTKEFVPGSANNEAEKGSAEFDSAYDISSIKANWGRHNIRVIEGHEIPTAFLRSEDVNFSYDANYVGDNLVAAAGPVSLNQLGSFLSNTICNQTLPIYHIVALDEVNLRSRESCLPHIYDYFISPGEIKTQDKQSGTTFNYEISKGLIKHKPSRKRAYHQSLKTVLDVHVNDEEIRKLHVTHFKLPKERYLTLNQKTYDLLVDCYDRSLSETILVHGATGQARTGHFIFTLKVAKYLLENEVSNLHEAALAINRKLRDMREIRAGLIENDSQLYWAIMNAYILFRCKKECIPFSHVEKEYELLVQSYEYEHSSPAMRSFLGLKKPLRTPMIDESFSSKSYMGSLVEPPRASLIGEEDESQYARMMTFLGASPSKKLNEPFSPPAIRRQMISTNPMNSGELGKAPCTTSKPNFFSALTLQKVALPQANGTLNYAPSLSLKAE